jgi:hypothetical protein
MLRPQTAMDKPIAKIKYLMVLLLFRFKYFCPQRAD